MQVHPVLAVLAGMEPVAGWSGTAVRKVSPASLYTVALVRAMTLAVRGDGVRERHLPDCLAALAPPDETPVLEDIELSRGYRIAGVRLLAWPDEDCPSRHLDRYEGGREAFERGCGQFGE